MLNPKKENIRTRVDVAVGPPLPTPFPVATSDLGRQMNTDSQPSWSSANCSNWIKLSFDPAAPFGGSRETTSALRHKTASQTISKDAVNGTVKRTGTATSRPRMETTPPPPGLTADDEADDDAGWSRAPRMAEKPNPESSSLDGNSSSLSSESSSEEEESEDEESMVKPPSLHIRTRSDGRDDDD